MRPVLGRETRDERDIEVVKNLHTYKFGNSLELTVYYEVISLVKF
jgi:hypothetical protein